MKEKKEKSEKKNKFFLIIKIYNYFMHHQKRIVRLNINDKQPLSMAEHISRAIKSYYNIIYHHGIVTKIIGDGCSNVFVVHWIGFDMNDAKLVETTLEEFLEDQDEYYIYLYKKEEQRDPQDTIQLAKYMVENKVLNGCYDFFNNNCECFAIYCKCLTCKANPYRVILPWSNQSKRVLLSIVLLATCSLVIYNKPALLPDIVKDLKMTTESMKVNTRDLCDNMIKSILDMRPCITIKLIKN